MNSQQRRQLKRLEARLRNEIIGTAPSKSPSQEHKGHKESSPPRSAASRYLPGAILRTKLMWTLVAAGLALIGGYRTFRPHVSVDPGLLLIPGDPFSTQFNVKNENAIFAVSDLHPSCYTIYVMTDHNVGLMGLPPRPTPAIPIVEPLDQTTIDCAPWLGGLGAGAGNVLVAFIEMDVAYKQNWWPSTVNQRFPFKGVIDSQKSVHWIHITPSELPTESSRVRR